MNREDEKRLELEEAVAQAKKGPDYSRLEGDIAREKSELHKRREARREIIERRRAAHYRMSWYYEVVYGYVPQFRER